MRLVYITLGWVAGLLLAITGRPVAPLAWAVLTFGAVVATYLMWPTRWRWAYIALLALMLGGLRASFLSSAGTVARFNDTGGLTVNGTVITPTDQRDTQNYLRARVSSVRQGGVSHPVTGTILLRTPRTNAVTYGDTVSATGMLAIPGTFDNFDYASYLAAQDVYSIMTTSAVEIESSGGGNPLYASILQLKQHTRNTINRSLPEPAAGLLIGILLGDDNGISPQLEADFAATGAAHIVAISGFNMAILAGVITALLDRTPWRGVRGGLLALMVIGIYTIFVGAGAAVVRAALMSGVLIIGQSLRRKAYVPASLALVALVMSAIAPRVLWSVSFQLSFFATLGLALFAEPFTSILNRSLKRLFSPPLAHAIGDFLTEPLAVTLAALVPTLPLISLYFNRVSLIQLPVNLLIVPVQPVILIGGLLATGIGLLSPTIAQPIFWMLMVLLRWTIGVVRAFADLPFAQIELYPDGLAIILFFALLIGGAMLQATQPKWSLQAGRFVRSRMVLSTLTLIGIAMLWLGVSVYRARPDAQLHVYMLDVGHSNGWLIQTPGGAQILVDGGRFPSRLLTQIGDRLPFNDQHLELVVVTQPDERFYSALPTVFSRYSVGAVLTNGQPNESEAYATFIEAASAYPMITVKQGYQVEFDDGTQLEVLAPAEQPTLSDPLDDNVLVLRVSYGDISFLLTGDASQANQAALMELAPDADVLQLPGHAGQRSIADGFIDVVGAQVYLLHNDRANRLGHPDPDVISELPEEIPLYRTDQNGTVHLWTDGLSLWVQDGEAR